MHGRILFGIVAWLLGAATATAGSLLAVSLLGQGLTGASGALLSQDTVNRALSSEAAESGAPASPSAPATSSPAGPAARWPAALSSSPSPSPSPPATTSAPAATPSASAATPGGTVLASGAGDVVASCPGGLAYLGSWSPAQGYLVGPVYRGPGQDARVMFEPAADTGGSAVTMVVSCSGGVPAARTHTRESGDD